MDLDIGLELLTDIHERTYKNKWLEFCRTILLFSDKEIEKFKRHASSEDMYKNINRLFDEDPQKFKDLLGQHGIEPPDENGSAAIQIYRLIDHVQLEEYYDFIRHTCGNEEYKPTQFHDGILPRKIMQAMLGYWCKKVNPTYDRLQKIRDVAKKKGFWKPKNNATHGKRQKLIDNAEGKEENKGDGFLKPKERSEDVFQDEITEAFTGITRFKKFARSSRGLCLDEHVIQGIVENHEGNVEEQKLKMLNVWKEKIGEQATVRKIRELVDTYKKRDEPEDPPDVQNSV